MEGIVYRGRLDEPTQVTPQRIQQRRRRSISRTPPRRPFFDLGLVRGARTLLHALPSGPALPFIVLGALTWLATLAFGLVLITGPSAWSLSAVLLPNVAPAFTSGASLVTFAHRGSVPAVFFIAWLFQSEQTLLAASMWAFTFALFGSPAAALKLCLSLKGADGDMERFWTGHHFVEENVRRKGQVSKRGGKAAEPTKDSRSSLNTHFTRSAGPAMDIRM